MPRSDVLRLALAATLALAAVAPATFALDDARAATDANVAPSPAARGARLAEMWADLEVRDLDGRVWSAADLEGRVVLLEFWATWCAPCLADFPRLARARAAYGDRGLVILSISLDRAARSELQSFGRRHGVTWPVVFDGRGAAGSVARRFQVEYPPRSLLFDRLGRLVALDARGVTLDAALRALFAAE